MKQNWVKVYIVDILPCIAVSLYILAIVYNLALFSHFGIDILTFLSLTELLIGIVEPLLVTALFVFITCGIIVLPMIDLIQHERIKFKTYSKRIKYLRNIVKNIDKYHIRYLRNKIRKMRIIDKDNKDIITSISLYVLVIYIISYFLFSYNVVLYDYGAGMGRALCGLLIPISIVPVLFVYSIATTLTVLDIRLDETVKKITSFDKVFIGFITYIYAIAIFYQSGSEYACEIQKKPKTEFSIKMSDGSIFDNSKFGYISRINDKIFLFSKSSDENVILEDEGIIYTKITGTSQRSLLIRAIKNK